MAFVYFNHHVLMRRNTVGLQNNTIALNTKTVRNDLNGTATANPITKASMNK